MSETHLLLKGLRKAVGAEEKQGYINTGAIGGFSFFLSEILPGLKGIFTAGVLEELRIMSVAYSGSSPSGRKEMLEVLKKYLHDIHPEAVSPVAVTTKSVTVSRKADVPKNLQYLKGVGPQRSKQFENIGVRTIADLLMYYPKRYEIRTRRRIDELKDNELVTITGKVTGSQVSSGRVKVVKLNIEQDGRNIHAVWFNQIYIPKQFTAGTMVMVTGKVRWNKQVPELLAGEIVRVNDKDAEGPVEEIVPVYPEVANLNSKIIRGIVKNVLPQTDIYFQEILPEDENGLMPRPLAYKEIHFPSSVEAGKKARARLVIEEVLLLQLALKLMRSPVKTEVGLRLNSGGEFVKKLINSLPFKLTEAQNKVIREIFRDMADDSKCMTRLLQGDVGSGKTIVAMAAILQAAGSGYQAAMMAPTEVLAQQHFNSLKDRFEPLAVNVVLLTGSQSKTEKDQILDKIMTGKAQVVVGTQALIQETVSFLNLGLVITDEQHRFGVRQRTLLQSKGKNPHVLVMTATPIPRTLALTLYGDLQLSVLNEMPPGRRPVITKKISDRSRASLEKFLEQHIALGRQVYYVCPLVEETEKNDLVSATETAEELKQRFPKSQVDLLHGRMKSQEKEEIMKRFKNGDVNILVATTVIEVGVDVPNASVMVVEGAERFGLAQLHQLRGRVGRGKEQSYCILISNSFSSTRLNILCQTEDGFKIAEEDLKIRGAGELLGLRQHGVPELRLTDLTSDGILVEEAYVILQKAISDPQKYRRLFEEVERFYTRGKAGVN